MALKEHERLEKIASLIRRLNEELSYYTMTKEDRSTITLRLLEYALDNCYMEEEWR